MNRIRTCTACGYKGKGWKHIGDQDGRSVGLGVVGLYNCPSCGTTKSFEPKGKGRGRE